MTDIFQEDFFTRITGVQWGGDDFVPQDRVAVIGTRRLSVWVSSNPLLEGWRNISLTSKPAGSAPFVGYHVAANRLCVGWRDGDPLIPDDARDHIAASTDGFVWTRVFEFQINDGLNSGFRYNPDSKLLYVGADYYFDPYPGAAEVSPNGISWTGRSTLPPLSVVRGREREARIKGTRVKCDGRVITVQNPKTKQWVAPTQPPSDTILDMVSILVPQQDGTEQHKLVVLGKQGVWLTINGQIWLRTFTWPFPANAAGNVNGCLFGIGGVPSSEFAPTALGSLDGEVWTPTPIPFDTSGTLDFYDQDSPVVGLEGDPPKRKTKNS